MMILTHRGIDRGKKNYFTESSYEAFADQISRGFGLELDINFSGDKKIFFFHDKGLDRISRGSDKRTFSRLTLGNIKKIRINKDRLCDFDEMMGLLKGNDGLHCALHLKGHLQKKEYIDILAKYLKKYPPETGKIIVFDVTIKTARYLKKIIPDIIMAPSVAHEYDIKRYNNSVGRTLISLNEAIANKNLFKFVWLDEWDLINSAGGKKELYTEANFKLLRYYGFKICLVTPELHATSPNLLGGENHSDGLNRKRLLSRMKKIIKLSPDYICTDYPDMAKSISK